MFVPLAVLGWVYRVPINGIATTATSYGAKTVCSCHYVAGRPTGQCRSDLADPWMRLVLFSDDEDGRTVTARIPLLSTQKATYRKGWGCLLEPWDQD